MNLPTHCGEPMDVCAGGIFECIVCDARMTAAQIEDREQSISERRFEQQMSEPSMSMNEQHERAQRQHRELHR